MTPELDRAFELLTQFKEGKIAIGNRVTPRQLRLVRLLVEDVVPRIKLPEKIDRDVFDKVLLDVCEQDTRWNRKLMRAMVLAADAQKEGRRGEGLAYLDTFIEECPSSWYRAH